MPRARRLRTLSLGSLLLGGLLSLGCPPAEPPRAADQRPRAAQRAPRRSSYAERLQQGRDLARLKPRRKALDQALAQPDPDRQLADTRRELGRLRAAGIRFALHRHDASAPLTVSEAESLREGVRPGPGRPTLAVVVELRLGIENELPLQITARELYRSTYELLVEHLRSEAAR